MITDIKAMQDIMNQTSQDSFQNLDKTIEADGDISTILTNTKNNINRMRHYKENNQFYKNNQ
jgi:hypothetical protein